MVLAHRPQEAPLLGLELGRSTPAREIHLGGLTGDETAVLATTELLELFEHEPPGGNVLEELASTVVERADGNPLWVRELCRFLVERTLDESDSPTTSDGLELPGSLHGLVLSRLDRLAETPRRTAKVASVVGRAFAEPLVVHGYPELGAEGDIHQALQELEMRDVAVTDDVSDKTWLFTHTLLRDVAYESLPFSLRTLLHERVAAALEDGVLGDPARWIDQLAHHFWYGEDNDKKRHYLRLAGAAAQAAYDHVATLLSYERLLTLLPEGERSEILIQIGKTRELQGDWAAAEASYLEALRLAGEAGDTAGATWARTWWAEVARKQGRYDDAATGLAAAAAAFAELGDDAGVGQVWHLSGTLAAQQGDFTRATESYDASLVIRERLGDRTGMAALLSNLAIVAEYQGDYAAATELGERGLALRREIGDRWAIGISQNNLGMLATLQGRPEEAKERFAESMALHSEVGDSWMVAVGHNNLGNAHRDLGELEQARGFYAEALRAYHRQDDVWALAILYEDVALLDAASRRPEDAWRLIGASDAAREQLGSPRTPDVWTRLHDSLDPLSQSLGPDGVDRLRAEGAALAPDDVDQLVRAAGQ